MLTSGGSSSLHSRVRAVIVILFHQLSGVIEYVPRVALVFLPAELSLYFLRTGRLFSFSVHTALLAFPDFMGLFLFGTAREFFHSASQLFIIYLVQPVWRVVLLFGSARSYFSILLISFSPLSLFPLLVLPSVSDFPKIIFVVCFIRLLQTLTQTWCM